MSESRLSLDADGLRLAAELDGVVLEAGPLDDLHWVAPDGLRLEQRTRRRIVRQDDYRVLLEPDEGEDAYLVWQPSALGSGRIVRGVTRDLLVRFASLSAAPDEDILAFATQWGPLRLCAHHLPGTHRQSEWYEEVPGLPGCKQMSLWNPVEEVADWRQYAAEAAAIIEITAALRQGTPTSRQMWQPMRRLQRDEPLEADTYWAEDLSPDDQRPDALTTGAILESQRDRLDQWINWWLANSGAAPRYQWRRGGLVTFASGGLFAALAYKLARIFEEDTHYIRCFVCGEFETRDRKPQAGRRTYCTSPDCAERGRRRASYRKITFVKALGGDSKEA